MRQIGKKFHTRSVIDKVTDNRYSTVAPNQPSSDASCESPFTKLLDIYRRHPGVDAMPQPSSADYVLFLGSYTITYRAFISDSLDL